MQSKVFRVTLACTDSQLHSMERCPLVMTRLLSDSRAPHEALQDWACGNGALKALEAALELAMPAHEVAHSSPTGGALLTMLPTCL